jgi:hypothetical protein
MRYMGVLPLRGRPCPTPVASVVREHRSGGWSGADAALKGEMSGEHVDSLEAAGIGHD